MGQILIILLFIEAAILLPIMWKDIDNGHTLD